MTCYNHHLILLIGSALVLAVLRMDYSLALPITSKPFDNNPDHLVSEAQIAGGRNVVEPGKSKKITKSIFITPPLDEPSPKNCQLGYKVDRMGQCIETVHFNKSDLLEKQINSILGNSHQHQHDDKHKGTTEYDYEDYDTPASEVHHHSNGPYHVHIPVKIGKEPRPTHHAQQHRTTPTSTSPIIPEMSTTTQASVPLPESSTQSTHFDDPKSSTTPVDDEDSTTESSTTVVESESTTTFWFPMTITTTSTDETTTDFDSTTATEVEATVESIAADLEFDQDLRTEQFVPIIASHTRLDGDETTDVTSGILGPMDDDMTTNFPDSDEIAELTTTTEEQPRTTTTSIRTPTTISSSTSTTGARVSSAVQIVTPQPNPFPFNVSRRPTFTMPMFYFRLPRPPTTTTSATVTPLPPTTTTTADTMSSQPTKDVLLGVLNESAATKRMRESLIEAEQKEASFESIDGNNRFVYHHLNAGTTTEAPITAIPSPTRTLSIAEKFPSLFARNPLSSSSSTGSRSPIATTMIRFPTETDSIGYGQTAAAAVTVNPAAHRVRFPGPSSERQSSTQNRLIPETLATNRDGESKDRKPPFWWHADSWEGTSKAARQRDNPTLLRFWSKMPLIKDTTVTNWRSPGFSRNHRENSKSPSASFYREVSARDGHRSAGQQSGDGGSGNERRLRHREGWAQEWKRQ